MNHAVPAETGQERFAIGFDHRDRARLHELWDGILDSDRWSEGEVLEAFEGAGERQTGLPAIGLGSWADGAACALGYAGVRGERVLCPSNTFMATPLSILRAGGEPVFVDCNRE